MGNKLIIKCIFYYNYLNYTWQHTNNCEIINDVVLTDKRKLFGSAKEIKKCIIYFKKKYKINKMKWLLSEFNEKLMAYDFYFEINFENVEDFALFLLKNS